ncbi:MAG: trypsin-like peptidase domain-containing protein [Opitutales bacterium]
MKKLSFFQAMAGSTAGLTLLVGLLGLRAAETTTAASLGDKSAVAFDYDASPLDRTNREPVSYADMLDKVVPAVVSVSPTVNVSGGSNMDDRMRQFLRRYYGNTPSGQVEYGVGSGSIITPDGYILTNHHVITGPDGRPADGIHVKLADGREFDARVIGSDEKTDIALIKIDATGLPTIKLADSDKLKVGDVVFAVGDPMDVGFTVTHGIVSATGRSNLGLLDEEQGTDGSGASDTSFENFIQTDASINPGNSGGPLVDAEGRQVGMDAAILSRSGGSIGIGFAIPSSLLRQVIHDLADYGMVRRGYLGVHLQDLDRDLAQGLGLPSTHGALINAVDPNMPAELAGMRPGDVVVKMNDQDVDSTDKLRFLVASNEPGTLVSLTVLREGQPQVIQVRLADSNASAGGPLPNAEPPARNGYSVPSPAAAPSSLLEGLTLEPLTTALHNKYNIPGNLIGVVVTNVDNDSPYADQLTEGAVVLAVNGRPVASLREMRALLVLGKPNVLYVSEDGHFSYVPVIVPTQQ